MEIPRRFSSSWNFAEGINPAATTSSSATSITAPGVPSAFFVVIFTAVSFHVHDRTVLISASPAGWVVASATRLQDTLSRHFLASVITRTFMRLPGNRDTTLPGTQLAFYHGQFHAHRSD